MRGESNHSGSRKINFKSDFKLIQPLAYHDPETGKLKKSGFPPYGFRLLYFTVSPANCYEASYHLNKDGEPVYKNMLEMDGKIVVIFDRHNLTPGDLNVIVTMDVPDGLYPDGYQHEEMPYRTDVKLWHGISDGYEIEAATAILPYVFITAYRMAIEAGYEGTQEEFMKALAQVGDIGEIAGKAGDVVKALEEWENEKVQYLRIDQIEEYSDEEMDDFLNNL